MKAEVLATTMRSSTMLMLMKSFFSVLIPAAYCS